MNKIINENKTYLKTGYDELDKMMAINKSSAMITIWSRPRMGKTSLAFSFAANLVKNKKVLIFSQELPTKQVIFRFLCQYFDVDFLYNKKSSYILPKTDILNFIQNLYIDDTFIITTDYIENKIKEIKPDVVFIDYLQLIHPPKNGHFSNIKEENSDIIENLKRISKENNLIIFLNAQLASDVDLNVNKIPILSNLNLKQNIEENFLDVVIFIYRPDYYKLDAKELKKLKLQDAQIIVAKNNFGNCGTVNMIFDSSIPKFFPKK